MNLQIELSTICNWDCDYCPRPYLTREKEFIYYATFYRAIDTFIEETTTLILSKDGEPLMHPLFKELFTYATSKYSGKIDIYTNGVYLTEDIVDILGAVTNNVNIFVTDHTISRTGTQDPTKTLLNFTNAVSKNYSNLSFSLTKHAFNGETEEDQTWLSSWRAYKTTNSNVVAIHLNTHKNSWAGFVDTQLADSCPFMEYEFVGVGITGNVTMCCLDLNEELIAGNILTDSKIDILESRNKYRALITHSNIKNIKPCNRCIVNCIKEGWN